MQQGHATEGPGAGPALVLLHFGVGLQVGTQVGAVRKGPVTVLTGEGTFTWLKGEEEAKERRVSIRKALH